MCVKTVSKADAGTKDTAVVSKADAGIKDNAILQDHARNVQQWKKQLITHEDRFHVHKLLGISVLCSYVWRLSLFVLDPESDMGFRTHPELTLPTLLLHFALNASALKFRIPKRRIKVRMTKREQ